MKTINLNKVLTFIGLLLLLLFTYFRENFLLQINAFLAGKTHNRAYYYWLSDFFYNLSRADLTKWKWGLTFLFALLMSVVTIYSLHSWFKRMQFTRIISFFYIAAFSFVVLIAVIGFLSGSFNEIYFVLRKVLGIIQSPIPFFAFFALFTCLKE